MLSPSTTALAGYRPTWGSAPATEGTSGTSRGVRTLGRTVTPPTTPNHASCEKRDRLEGVPGENGVRRERFPDGEPVAAPPPGVRARGGCTTASSPRSLSIGAWVPSARTRSRAAVARPAGQPPVPRGARGGTHPQPASLPLRAEAVAQMLAN
jgi:hypothetical protein